jgi:hypothetical protein
MSPLPPERDDCEKFHVIVGMLVVIGMIVIIVVILPHCAAFR